jgi:hypothetical protein
MIFNIEEIKTYETTEEIGEIVIKQTYKLHKPTGVFFSSNVNRETNEFLYFVVAVINENKETEERKTFDGVNQQSFFEAVAYFESLIEERIPAPKQEPPSVGRFYYVKGQNSFVILDFGDNKPIIIERDDLEKVFSPPRKKPYGRLNMLAVDKPEYEPIKQKFALGYNDGATNEFLEKMNLNEGEAAVYDMTPYQSEPQNNQQQQQQEPQDVNDEDLTLDKIEDEEPENLKGDNKEEGEPQEGEPQDGDNEGDGNDEGDEKDGEPKKGKDKGDKERKNKDQKPGDKDDNDKSDRDGGDDVDIPNDDDQNDDGGDYDDGDKERKNDNQKRKPSKDKKKGKPGEPTDEDGEPADYGQTTEDGDDDFGDDEDGKDIFIGTPPPPSDVIDQISSALGVDDAVYSYRKQNNMISAIKGLSEAKLKETLYEPLGVNKDTPKARFLEMVKSSTQEFFE